MIESQAIVDSKSFHIAELLAVSAYSKEMVPHGHHDICCYAILSIPIFNVSIAIIYAFSTDSFEWIVYIQSMTLFSVIDRRQWHFFKAHLWPHVIDQSQWHMAISLMSITKMSLTGQWHFLTALLEAVIDRTMTHCKGAGPTRVSAKIVSDQSITHFDIQSENCHWPVNDSL